ncbi:MAG TPA: hypothetical protein VKQ11_17175 [Candidatus Sulfotelmatobacter sp.]|nr:hypothetical protein [Candidatus Sulfotelmatobacter sp.]
MSSPPVPPTPPNNPLTQAEDTVEQLTRSFLPRLHFWTRAETWAAFFRAIEDVVDQFVDKSIHGAVTNATSGALDPDRLKSYMEIARYRREKVPLKTDITDQIISICQQILGFGAAGLALAVGFLDKVKAFSVPLQKAIAVAGIFYFELIGLSLTVLVWYMLQAHFRYPFLYFKKIGNAPPYFYYASITPVPRSPIQFAKSRFLAASSYAKDFLKFTQVAFTETDEQRLRDEFQQYFLLMAYSGYVQQFSQRLTNVFFYGLFGAITSALAFAIAIAATV